MAVPSNSCSLGHLCAKANPAPRIAALDTPVLRHVGEPDVRPSLLQVEQQLRLEVARMRDGAIGLVV